MDKKFFPLVAGIIVLFIFIIGIFVFTSSKSAKNSSTKKDTASTSKNGAKADGLVREINSDSILESQNGGETFSPQFRISTTGKVGDADVLSVAFHPEREGFTIVGSVNDGLFKREEATTTWTPITFPPKSIYSFILDKNDPDNRMFASGLVEKNGRILRTNDGGENWRAVYNEPGLETTVTALSQHHKDPSIIFAGTSGGTVIKSTDGGESWKNLGNKIAGTIQDIAFDANVTVSTYLLTLGSKIYYSPDGGLTWLDWEEEKKKEVRALQERSSALRRTNSYESQLLRDRATELTRRNEENKMPSSPITLVADPRVSGTIYVGTTKGLFRSVDYGKYWYEVNVIESAKAFPIRSIAINPNNSREIIFIAGKSFYKSRNHGDTWAVTPLSSSRDASFVAYDPLNTERIVVGVSAVVDSARGRSR